MKVKQLLEKYQFPEAFRKTKGQIVPCASLESAKTHLSHLPSVIVKCPKSDAYFLMTKEDFNVVKDQGFVQC